MVKHEEIEMKAEKLILPVLEKYGCSLVDVEYVKEAGNWYLRYYIDKEGGVGILDCENVSRAVNPMLDEDDFVPDAYTLEVSSPGLGRALKKDRDFERNIGKEIEIRLFRAVEGRKECVAVLDSYDKSTITVTDENGEFVIERKNLALIREYVDWDAE